MKYVVISTAIIILNAIIIMSLLLNIHPFRLSNRRRNCFFLGVAGILLLQILGVVLMGIELYAKCYLLFAQLPTLLLFCAVAKQGFAKPFFVMLTTIFLCSPGMTVTKICNAGLHLQPEWTMAIILIVDISMLYIIWKYMKPSFDYILDIFHTRDILGFCATPLLYNFMILSTGGYLISRQNMKFRILICLSTLAAFFLLMNVFRRTKDMNDLQYEKSMMAVQISTAQQRMAELYHTTEVAKIYRHDMRHHLSLIGSYAEQGEMDKIKDYISRAENEIRTITPTRFCKNETVNLIISSFEEKATKEGITLSVRVNLPQELNIPDTELCSVISNGLENAMNAVSKVGDATLRKVHISSSMERNMLLLMIENAYSGEIQMEKGVPTPVVKGAGHGFGCRSMLSIAEKRKGFCTFKAEDGVFTLRVVLPIDKECVATA